MLAVTTVLAACGCSSAAPAAAVTHPAHDLTLAAARNAYHNYVTTSNTAAANGDQTQGLAIAADAQWAVAKGQYTALASAGMPVTQYRYGQPVFYVPALSDYPHWFVVSVPRSTDTDGHPGAAVNTIMLFDQLRPGQPWTLTGSAVLDQRLPAIARDSDGYAIDMTTSDPMLLLRPDVVGATQAAVVDQGPANAAAAVIASGPQTTGLYAAQDAYAKAQAAKNLQYQWLLEGAAFPQFQMRTADGGALVFYGMYLNTTTEHPNLLPGSPIPVPADFSPLLAAPTEVGYHAVYANWTFEFVANDPPLAAHHAKVAVIAGGGGPSYGHAY